MFVIIMIKGIYQWNEEKKWRKKNNHYLCDHKTVDWLERIRNNFIVSQYIIGFEAWLEKKKEKIETIWFAAIFAYILFMPCQPMPCLCKL